MRTTVRKSADAVTAKADLLVVCVPDPPGRLAGPAAAVDAALGGLVARAVKDREITGEAGSATRFHAGDALASPRAVVVGVAAGAVDDWRAAGRAAAGLTERVRTRSVALVPPDDATPAQIGAFIEGFGLAGYRFDRFRTNDASTTPPAERLTVHSPAFRSADARRADRIVEAVNGARDLSNTPSQPPHPAILAEHAKALADAIPGLTCTVLGTSKLEKLGRGRAARRGAGVGPSRPS